MNMSFNSEKSLNEEVVEALENVIIQRSQSNKSLSEESLFADDEEETLSSLLVQELTPSAVARLRRCFRKGTGRDKGNRITNRIEEVMHQAAAKEGIEFPRPAAGPSGVHDELWIDEDGFVNAIEGIFGANKFTPHARELFRTLGGGRLRWRELARRLLVPPSPPAVINAKLHIVTLKHANRETLVKLVALETKEWFCYAAVSRGGRVGVYSGDMKLLYNYEVFYHRTGMSKRFKNRWITDAVFMSDVKCLAISSSDRSISIYEAATINHTPLYCITGIPDIPTCVAYCPYHQLDSKSQLVFGSSRGDVTLLTFLRPRFRLFHSSDQDQTNTYFWNELFSSPHTSYCSISRWRAHARSVARVAFARRGLVLSCSHDCDVSLRAKHTAGQVEDYIVKVQRGISCFHYSSLDHSIAVGSRDGVVRVYCRGQPRPYSTMATPNMAAVLDVVLRPEKEMLVAFCVDCSLHLWNIYDETLLQTIKIKFPFLGILGKKPEFGTYSIHPGPARQGASRPASPAVSSRRSSVVKTPRGGLALEVDEDINIPDDDSIHPNYCGPELLVTSCAAVCRVSLDTPPSPPRPPPPAQLSARTPSHWDLPTHVFRGCTSASPPPPCPSSPPPAGAQLRVPPLHASTPAQPQYEEVELPTHDLDTLLKNAGLEGILEKDFVLMFGLKHDLNKKLAEMEAKKASMCEAVSQGAVYLSLSMSEPAPLPPPDLMTEQYNRIAGMFPPSIAATPAPSERSTPRERRTNK